MSIAFVQDVLGGPQTSTTNNTTLSLTTSVAVSAGDKLIGAAACRLGSVTQLVSVSGGGLTWTIDVQEAGSVGNNIIAVFSADAPSGLPAGTTITLTYDAATSRKVGGLFEYSGVATGAPDQTAAAQFSGTAATSGTTATTAQANELLVGAFESNVNVATASGTPGSGYTERADTSSVGASNQPWFYFEDQIVSATGSYTATATCTTSGGGAGVIATYEAAGGAPVNLTATDALTSFGGAATPTVTIAATATDALTAFRGSATATVTIHPTATDALTAFRGSASMTSGTFLTATDALTAFRGAATMTLTIAVTAIDALTAFRGGATMTFIPPFTPPGAGTPWEAYLCDRFGYPIQNISRVCFGKQYAATLNRPAQFTFWAPSNDPKIGGLHTDGNPYLMEGRAIRVYRAGVLVFTGHVWQIEDSGDENEEKTSVTCFDPLQWWSRRVARRMVYVNLTIGSPSINLYVSLFTNKDDDVYTFQSTNAHSSTETARGLLNSTNDYDGFTGLDDFYQSSIYRPNVATPSLVTNQSAPSSGNVNIAFANSRLSDLLTALVGQSGNFDLEVVPTDSDYYSSATAGPFHGGSRSATFQQAYKFGWAGDYDTIRGSLLTKPWKTLALLKYWAPLKGSQQDSVIFGYDAYPHNVSQISRLVDLQNLTNNSVMLGSQNWAREVNITSVQAYGAGMDVQGLSDIVDPVLLDALAAEEVQLGGNAKQTVQITPLGGARTPLPFDDFVLGDQVHVNAGSRLRGGFLGLQRVYGFVLDINDDHTTETLSSLVTSPQTS